MKFGLRAKYILLISAFLLFFTVLVTIVNIRAQRQILRERLIEKATAVVSILAATLTDPLATSDMNRLKMFLGDALVQEDVVYAYVFDQQGFILTDGTAEYKRKDMRLTDPVSRKAVAAEDWLMQFNGEIVDVTEPIYRGYDKIGGVRLGFSLKRMQREDASAFHRHLTLGGIFALLGGILAFCLARSIMGSVARLIEGTRAVARGEFDGKIEINTRDELAVLADCFNHMTEDLKRSRVELARQAQQLASANAALQRKNAELDSFVYIVSHDLKSPLVAIQGMSNILLEEHAGSIDQEGRHFLERIQANTLRLEDLVTDLLSLSRIGREARAPETVNLAEVVDNALLEFAEPIRTQGIQVARGNLETLRGLRVQIEQVMGNLIGNAIKYMGDTPSPQVEIGTVDRGEFVECFVKDNGIGIDPAYHEKVFEVFQRLVEIEREGTGVGLAIVRKIVEGAGGRVWVESAKGQGATFRFTWPRDPKAAHPNGLDEVVADSEQRRSLERPPESATGGLRADSAPRGR